MCLFLFGPQIRPTSTVTIYKVLRRMNDGRLVTQYQYTAVPLDGILVSDRKSPEITWLEQRYEQVRQGIHVYTSFGNAKASAWASMGEFVVPGTAEPGDWVACSLFTDQAVFMKVQLDLSKVPSVQRNGWNTILS